MFFCNIGYIYKLGGTDPTSCKRNNVRSKFSFKLLPLQNSLSSLYQVFRRGNTQTFNVNSFEFLFNPGNK